MYTSISSIHVKKSLTNSVCSYSTAGRVPRHCGNPLHPQNRLPLVLLVRRIIGLPQFGHAGAPESGATAAGWVFLTADDDFTAVDFRVPEDDLLFDLPAEVRVPPAADLPSGATPLITKSERER